jgi:hypothetical protein
MIRTRALLAGAALLCGLVAMAPAAAQAAPAAPKPADTAAAVASDPDGKIHVWDGINRSGTECSWIGNSADWTIGCWEVSNDIESVENRGYAGGNDDVNLYYNDNYSGSYACIGRGDMWLDLSLGIEKFHAPGEGQGKTVYHDVASHKWVPDCH